MLVLVDDAYQLEGMETQHIIDTDIFQMENIFNELQRLYAKGNASLMAEHRKTIERMGRELQVLGQVLKESL